MTVLILLINKGRTQSGFHRLPRREQPHGVVSSLPLCSDKSDAATELTIHRMIRMKLKTVVTTHTRGLPGILLDISLFPKVIYQF